MLGPVNFFYNSAMGYKRLERGFDTRYSAASEPTAVQADAPAVSTRFDLKKLTRIIGVVFTLGIFCLALWVLNRTLGDISISEVLQQFRELPVSAIVLSLGATTLGYLVLTGYDVLALNYVRHRLPYRRTALASFIAYALANNLGFSLLTGTSVRYRIYTPAGLSALEIAGVSTICAATFAVGTIVVLAILLLAGPAEFAAALDIPSFVGEAPAALVLLATAGYMLFVSVRPTTIQTRNWSFQLPSAPLATAQIVLAALDLLLAASALYVLLPAYPDISFLNFSVVFILALVAGSASHVPGGIGVFESVLLLGLPDAPKATLLGAILCFRCIYYIAPLIFASVLLAGHEFRTQQARATRSGATATDWLSEVTPQVLGITVMVGGVVLLFSGATPVQMLNRVVPLPLLEASHLLGSAAGLALVIVARGLLNRVDTAYHMTLLFLVIGLITAVIKGSNMLELAILGTILIALYLSRAEFYRHTSLHREGLTASWLLTMMVILGGTLFLGLVSFRHIEYSHALWWTFAPNADEPRFLRSVVVLVLVAIGFSIARLLRPAPADTHPPSPAELEQTRPLIAHTKSTRPNLVWLGDKRLLFSANKNAFIMYQIEGRSWVALGDPIGESAESAELVFAFRDLAVRHSGWPVFYLVSAETLPLYIDAGMSILKVGETARVALPSFSLTAERYAELKETHSFMVQQAGASVRIVEPRQIGPLIPELKQVSEEWAASQRTRGEHFTRGFFNPDYLANFYCAIAYNEKDEIVAFGNLWQSGGREELAIDLLRYRSNVPEQVMDYLVTEVMLWGRAVGFQWFHLGLAPLAGLENTTLSPLWERIGAVLYRYGEHFHNYNAVREYKAKFDPVWKPKYLAAFGGMRLPRILMDISNLISATPTHASSEGLKN